VKIQKPNGIPDVIVDDPRSDRLFGDRKMRSPVERPFGLFGDERAGEPIGEDDVSGGRVVINRHAALFALAVDKIVYVLLDGAP
jgi:hypothetical protein